MAEKMTYVDALTIAVQHGNLSQEVNAKLTALIEQLNKKSKTEHKPTSVQKMNTSLQDVILNTMSFNEHYTISDMILNIPELNGLSNQKVSAIVHQMVERKDIERIVEKGKAYFVKTA